MNALKNILFFGLLFAVLCGVYFSLSRQPEQPLPAGLDPNVKPPTIEMGVASQPASTATAPSANNSTAATPPPKLEPWSSGREEAPRFASGDSRAKASDAHDQVSVLPPPPRENGPANAQSSLPSLPAAFSPPPSGLPPSPDARADRNYPAGASDPFAANNSAGGRNAATPSPSLPATFVSLPGPPTDDHSRTAQSAPAGQVPGADSGRIDTIKQQVELMVRGKKWADALLLLTPLQDNPDVPKSEAAKITDLLDCMAAKVIYSREHLLERPYGVQPGDTLDSIAEHFNVPALLLARINGIDPQSLRPGKELKVLKGPFSAHVSTESSEMKMMLDGRYAGRFPTALSGDLRHVTGLYKVTAKSQTRANGSPTKPEWIELELGKTSAKIGIEAAPDPRSAAATKRSTLWMSEQDMDDVYGILSVGSVVIIQR
jgi:LysM repeat protein